MSTVEVSIPPFKKWVNPRFVEIMENTDRYLILWGTRNSSKSVSAARKLIVRCITEDYFRYILVRKTYESIKDSQWQTIKDEVEALGLSRLFTFKISPLEIICFNGNKFIARGLDKADKLKSIKDPTGVWWEEFVGSMSNQVTLEDFITVTTSVRSIRADYIQEIISLNPQTEGVYQEFWFWKMFFKGHSELSFRCTITANYTVRGKAKSFTYHYTVHHSTYLDNAYLNEQQIADLEALKDVNEYWYKVYTLGIWANKEVGDMFWKGFDHLKHVRDDIFIDPTEPLHISFDENVNPYPALTIWQMEYFSDSVEVRQIHEICLKNPNNKVQKVAQEFRRWATLNGWSSKVFIFSNTTVQKHQFFGAQPSSQSNSHIHT